MEQDKRRTPPPSDATIVAPAAAHTLNVMVAIKGYLPAEVAIRAGDNSVSPRWAEDCTAYQNGLDGFLVEARTLATFRHPGIVRVARFFEAHRTAYMVLEYERRRAGYPCRAGRAGPLQRRIPQRGGLGAECAA